MRIHVDATLVAIAKIKQMDNVPESKWDEVEAQLNRLHLDRFHEEATQVRIPEWKPRVRDKNKRKAA
ncbi:MAG: hypothetical protein ACPL7K_06290 [Armatimonadota bacterium]